MSDKQVVDLVDVASDAIGLNDADINDAVSVPKLEENKWYKGRIAAGGEITLTKNAHMMLNLPFIPLDNEGIERSPKLNYRIVLPWWTPASVLAQHDLPEGIQEKKPNTSVFLAIYARAAYGPDVAPPTPRKNDDGDFVFQGEVLEGGYDEAQEIRKEVMKKIDALFVDQVRNLESFTGDTFYFQPEYRTFTDANGQERTFLGVKTDFDDWDAMPKFELEDGDELGDFIR